MDERRSSGQCSIRGVLLVVALASTLHGEPSTRPTTAATSSPVTDASAWVARLRPLVPAKGWTISAYGDEVNVRRDQPVRYNGGINPVDDEPAEGTLTFELTLKFGPPLPRVEYERFAAENAAARETIDAMEKPLRDIPRSIPDPTNPEGFRPKTPEQHERVAAFRAAVAKLPHHVLPELYTPEQSITLRDPFATSYTGVYDKPIAAECYAVRENILMFFGRYDAVEAVRAADWMRERGR